MKKNYLFPVIILATLVMIAATKPFVSLPNGMIKGTPDIKSISALTFGNHGILFIGDSKGASVIAVDTKDGKNNDKAVAADISNIDEKIAASLGTQKANITITDMAVNPLSKKIYISVQYTDGTPVLLTVDNGNISNFSLKDINYSSIALNDVYAEDAKDARGRSMRVSTISDMGFYNGKVLVSGLSNKEFSSTLRSIPFPFTNVQDESSLEIYHASHGRYETTSPIRTFTTARINNKDYILASYTCTPLVLFPMDELKPGMHVKGRTVAEMGAGNTPIDMTILQKGGETFLVMANTSRAMSKVDYKSIAAFEGTLTERVSGTAGTAFVQLAYTGIQQMDKLDNSHLVMIQKQANGTIDLLTANDTNF